MSKSVLKIGTDEKAKAEFLSRMREKILAFTTIKQECDKHKLKYDLEALYTNLTGIKKLNYDNISYPHYNWNGDDNPNTITLKSNSSKPNVATKYTWELAGWDWDSDPKGWNKITAWSTSNDGDVAFVQPTAEISSPLKLLVIAVDKVKSGGLVKTMFSILSQPFPSDTVTLNVGPAKSPVPVIVLCGGVVGQA